MANMNITEDEIKKLKATKSATEWNAICDQIKHARGGQYPPDWWPRMKMSGLSTQIQASWQAMPNIELDRVNMKEIYSIGEQDPWRLTKESGYRLALAICKTGAEVISANVDTTCPPTHVCVRLRLEQSKVPVFIEHFQDSLDAVEVAMGQRSNEREALPQPPDGNGGAQTK